MSKKYVVIFSFILLVTIAGGGAFARLTSDKTPNQHQENSRKASVATINSEKLLKELLQEAKKTNELLEQLVKKQ